ncbi:lron-7 family protein [Megaselia abdita]
MRVSWSLFLIVSSLFLLSVYSEEVKVNTTTTAAAKTKVEPKHPPVETLKSALCKKCKCDKFKLLLDCSHLGLTEWFKVDEIDTLIYGSIAFETIDLSHNNLTEVPAFPNLRVKNLLLNFNKIDKIADQAFLNLTLLTKLDLSNNKINNNGFIPNIFEGHYSTTEYLPLEYLRELNLADNELHKLREDIFEHCDNLEILSLSRNGFKMFDKDTIHAIEDLHNLKFLDLSYMQLSNLPHEILHASDSLDTVVLTGNLFKKIPADALGNSINLKRLNLDENPIVEVGGDSVFPKLEGLEYLSLSYMSDLKTIGVGAFSNLPNLKTLQISHNQLLTTISVEAFASYDKKNTSIVTYPKLENLYLDSNNLKKLDEKLLYNWQSLQQINLNNNTWDCDDHNTWLVSYFVPFIHNFLGSSMTRNIKCATPADMKDKLVYEVHVQTRDSTVEGTSGGSIVLGIFIGIVVGIPMTFGVLLILRKYRNNTPSVNYNRARFENNFDI